MSHKSNLKVQVKFKPINIKPHNATEIKNIIFKVENYKSRKEYYRIAKQNCISEDIIDRYGMKFWEPYDLKIINSNPEQISDEPIDIL